MSNINYAVIIKQYNEDKKSLDEIAAFLGTSKSSVQRALVKANYKLDRKQHKYLLQENTNVENNVSRETIEKTVVRNYEISKKLDRALKLKAVMEDKKAVDIVREALESFIENKYFKM